MDERRPNVGGTGMVIASLLAVFAGLYMVGNTITSESDALKNRMGAVSGQLDALSVEVRTANDKVDRLRDELRTQQAVIVALQAKLAAQQPAVPAATEPAKH